MNLGFKVHSLGTCAANAGQLACRSERLSTGLLGANAFGGWPGGWPVGSKAMNVASPPEGSTNLRVCVAVKRITTHGDCATISCIFTRGARPEMIVPLAHVISQRMFASEDCISS